MFIAFLGPDICKALPFFYAFTGCDIISNFYGKEKCKAWDTRMCSEHKNTYTDVFPRLGNKPESVSDNDLDIIDRFEVELYIPSAKNISSYSLASVSLENFVCPWHNDFRKLPLSREALREQAKRACFYSGHLWVEAVEDIPLPDVSSGAGFLTKIKHCLYHYGKVELVQLQSTNSRPLVVATRKSETLVNVKGLATFPCVGVKRSVDLNQILLVFYRYLLYTIINVYF